MKLKIRTKILVWYAISFLILITVYVVSTLSFASTTINRNATETIKHETDEIAEDLHVEDDGRVIYKEDGEDETFRFLYDSIIYVIYENNTLKLGEIPASIDETILINLYEIQTYKSNQSTWLIYDVPIQDEYTLRAFYSTTASENTFNQVFLWMIIISPIMVLISLSGGYLIIKQAFKPIHTITNTALEISQEHYDVRVPFIDTKDEVSILSKTINQMLDSIELAIEREQSFTSNVSHELRTPLSVLRAQVEYLLDKNKNTTLNKDIKDILKQLGFMENLVNQLLEWVRSKHIQKSTLEPVDIALALQSMVESFDSLAESKRIKITLINPFTTLILMTDLSAFIRIFNNLISNAIKYNKVEGYITLSIIKTKTAVVIEVKDTGIGMSEDTLKKAFDPFYRADPSRAMRDSLGIGLSITKNLVENLSGSLELESTLGEGTIARVVFPII